MIEEEESGATPDQDIEYGETYEHAKHGEVEVTGIWHGVNSVDTARNINENEVIIVNYSIEESDHPVTELTDTLDEFIEAID